MKCSRILVGRCTSKDTQIILRCLFKQSNPSTLMLDYTIIWIATSCKQHSRVFLLQEHAQVYSFIYSTLMSSNRTRWRGSKKVITISWVGQREFKLAKVGTENFLIPREILFVPTPAINNDLFQSKWMFTSMYDQWCVETVTKLLHIRESSEKMRQSTQKQKFFPFVIMN